jgi:hypothetical protein
MWYGAGHRKLHNSATLVLTGLQLAMKADAAEAGLCLSLTADTETAQMHCE